MSSKDRIWLIWGDAASGFAPPKTLVGELRSLATVSKESQNKRRKYSMTSPGGDSTRNPQNFPALLPILLHQTTSWYLFSHHGTALNDAARPPASSRWTSERYQRQHVILGDTPHPVFFGQRFDSHVINGVTDVPKRLMAG